MSFYQGGDSSGLGMCFQWSLDEIARVARQWSSEGNG